MATTWQQMIDRVKASMGVNKSTDTDFPNTEYDSILMEIANTEIRPELRGILMEPEDSGWLETAPSYINIVAGTREYTPAAFDQIRSVHILRQTGDTQYQRIDPTPQARQDDIVTGSVYGWYKSGANIMLANTPDTNITNGLRVVIVPEIADALITANVDTDIPRQFHNAVFHDLRFALAVVKGADKLIRSFETSKREAREYMMERAHDTVGPSRQVHDNVVPGSGGLASY